MGDYSDDKIIPVHKLKRWLFKVWKGFTDMNYISNNHDHFSVSDVGDYQTYLSGVYNGVDYTNPDSGDNKLLPYPGLRFTGFDPLFRPLTRDCIEPVNAYKINFINPGDVTVTEENGVKYKTVYVKPNVINYINHDVWNVMRNHRSLFDAIDNTTASANYSNNTGEDVSYDGLSVQLHDQDYYNIDLNGYSSLDDQNGWFSMMDNIDRTVDVVIDDPNRNFTYGVKESYFLIRPDVVPGQDCYCEIQVSSPMLRYYNSTYTNNGESAVYYYIKENRQKDNMYTYNVHSTDYSERVYYNMYSNEGFKLSDDTFPLLDDNKSYYIPTVSSNNIRLIAEDETIPVECKELNRKLIEWSKDKPVWLIAVLHNIINNDLTMYSSIFFRCSSISGFVDKIKRTNMYNVTVNSITCAAGTDVDLEGQTMEYWVSCLNDILSVIATSSIENVRNLMRKVYDFKNFDTQNDAYTNKASDVIPALWSAMNREGYIVSCTGPAGETVFNSDSGNVVMEYSEPYMEKVFYSYIHDYTLDSEHSPDGNEYDSAVFTFSDTILNQRGVSEFLGLDYSKSFNKIRNLYAEQDDQSETVIVNSETQISKGNNYVCAYVDSSDNLNIGDIPVSTYALTGTDYMKCYVSDGSLEVGHGNIQTFCLDQYTSNQEDAYNFALVFADGSSAAYKYAALADVYGYTGTIEDMLYNSYLQVKFSFEHGSDGSESIYADVYKEGIKQTGDSMAHSGISSDSVSFDGFMLHDISVSDGVVAYNKERYSDTISGNISVSLKPINIKKYDALYLTDLTLDELKEFCKDLKAYKP